MLEWGTSQPPEVDSLDGFSYVKAYSHRCLYFEDVAAQAPSSLALLHSPPCVSTGKALSVPRFYSTGQ